MDTIREVADRDYGRAYQVRPNTALTGAAEPRTVQRRCSALDSSP
jgi:hypothetical protein